jgi:hypothetical protein
MRSRGSVAVALAAVALLGGCASFTENVQETADAAASGASATSGAGSTASEAADTSTAPGPSEAAPTTAGAPAPAGSGGSGSGGGGGATGQGGGSATRAPAPPASWPPETTLTANREAWGVYLIVAKTYSAAENAKMQQVYRDLQGLGYRGYSGTLCDAGAENAGVDESADAVAVYFTTKAQAQQFISGWNRPYVGYAQVATFCAS